VEDPVNDKRKPLSEGELKALLPNINGWSVAGGKLHREYKFRDFIEAWGFMTSAALVIQAMDHHPEWSNVYSKVVIDLVTHDAGGITLMDTELAGKLEELAGRLVAK
jgi:4a-hydroxytetrahydrobiopterin dehydratase